MKGSTRGCSLGGASERAVLPALVGLLGIALTTATLSAGELPFVLDLPGVATSVRYVPGALDRAAHVQDRFELLTQDFSSWSKRRVPLAIYVVGRDGWESVIDDTPYGLAASFGGGLVVAARGDDATVALWRRLLGGPLPTPAGLPLGSTPEEVASLALCDLTAQVEGARVLLRSAGIAFDSDWLAEVTAHAVALSTFARYETSRLDEIRGVFAALSRARGTAAAFPVPGALEELSLDDRLWYMSTFFHAADRMFELDGPRTARRVLKLARKNEGRLREADLFRLYPPLEAWRTASFAR